MTTYISETCELFFFDVPNGETPAEYLNEFISPKWKLCAIDEYNKYARKNKLELIKESEVENMNTFDSIVYLMNKIPEAASYNFVEVHPSKIDIMIEQGAYPINIKTDYDFEEFIESIGSYWDAK